MMKQQKTIPSAAQVAKLLIELAEQDRDVDQEPMTHMRLQKLLYYVQGWSIARLGVKAFDDHIEAWEHGPVVPTLYHTLKASGKQPVTSDQLGDEPIDPEMRSFVASVWADYRSHSTIRLRNMTHAESPWKDAWEKRNMPNRCQETISEDALREYFSETSNMPKPVKKFKRRTPNHQWFDEPSPFFAEGA